AALPITVHGCDLSPEAVAQSNARARSAGLGCEFFVHDALAGPLPRGYDVITNTLFMHHFGDDDAVRVLDAMRAAGPRLIAISDLVRSTSGLLLAHLACQALTRSYVVHYDGPRSVAAAFTRAEFAAIADRAGLAGHRIRPTWPFRFLFTWRAHP
ncbi:MAG: methyltransferase domain-containing protein, partial [Candidatus Hydrogenedentes bacterium]|nr:methyltransferase domain-containing protein [Candidatus Hydrogenedentota bacterium]